MTRTRRTAKTSTRRADEEEQTMADIANDETCATCSHLASMHQDTADGNNTGACTAPDCDCSAMKVGGQAATGDDTPPAADAPADSADAPSGDDAPDDAPQDSDPPTLAAAIDTVLDGILDSIDPTTLTDANAQQFYYLVQSADSSIDLLCAALGVSDPDEGISGTPSDEPATLAQAVDASVDAALLVAQSVTAPPAEVAQAISDLQGLEEQMDALLDGLGVADPDDKPDAAAVTIDGMSIDTDGNIVMQGTVVGRATPEFAARFAAGDPVNTEPAALPDAPTDVPEDATPFEMPIMVLEGIDTGDGRYIQPNCLTWRELPLPIMALTKTTWGHEEAELVARIDTVDRFDASTLTNPKTGQPYGTVTYTDYSSETSEQKTSPVMALKSAGVFSSLEKAEEIITLVQEQFLRGVSVDVGDVKSVLEFLDENGDPLGNVDEEDLWDIMFIDFDDVREVLIEGRVMGATICPFPAFEGAYIEIPTGDEESAATASTPALAASAAPGVTPPRRPALRYHSTFGQRACAPCENGGPIVASAGPVAPPAAWFEDPQLSEATPLTITEDGYIYGHLALWGTCHTNSGGYGSKCVKPPHSASGYSMFRTGAVMTAEGTLVSVGQITLDTNHAPLTRGAAAAADHYDNTGAGVADVAAGEDAHGIWVAGAVRPDATPEQIRKLRANALSGDWRQVGSSLELVAALAVPVPGFPVPRAMTAGGALSALTAAGGRAVIDAAQQQMSSLRELLAHKGEIMEAANEVRASRLRQRVHGN